MSTAAVGFVTSLSLIVAIGAQNAFVLRQGLRREHVLPVVLVCALADAVLIGAGIGGVGLAVARAPAALELARYGGAAFLIGYGLLAARRALRPRGMDIDDREPVTRRAVLATCMGLTFLNPHVYLDTVVLLGTIANQHGSDARWAFGTGAVAASAVWFSALGFGARTLSRFFERPRSWQALDVVIAGVMLLLAAGLLASSL
jgi:L-lysine exporter family protein LysE/ArgO